MGTDTKTPPGKVGIVLLGLVAALSACIGGLMYRIYPDVPLLWIDSLYLAPLGAFILTVILRVREKAGRGGARVFRRVVCLLSVGACLYLTSDLLLLVGVPRPARIRYADSLRVWKVRLPDLVDHFPPTIPWEAERVRFSHFSGLLQGGANIQLRYRTSPEEIASLHGRFFPLRTREFWGGNIRIHDNLPNGAPTTWFHTGDGGAVFPDDYQILVLDKEPKGGNHFCSHGVAISKQRNEIVYWAEHW